MEQQYQYNDMFKDVPANFSWEISSGHEGLDNLLGGGLLKGAISQLHGEAGTAKTQLAMQFMIGASLNRQNSFYISTSKQIHVQRFKQLKQNFQNRIKKLIAERWEIYHCGHNRSFEQGYMAFINKLQQQHRLSKQHTSLLIIDNITSVIENKLEFQQQFGQKINTYYKAKIQKEFVNNLRADAKKKKFAVLFINNASSFNQNNSFQYQTNKNIKAAMGKSWDTQLDECIFVSKSQRGKRKIKLLYSPKAPSKEINFELQKDGGFIFQ